MRIAFTIVFVFFVAAVSLFHFINEEDRQERQREGEWLKFSIEHRCKIVRDQSFSNPTTLWQCDGGFQVRR